MLSTLGRKTCTQIAEVPTTPATAEACVALASNATVWLVMMHYFKIPPVAKPHIVS